MNQVWIARKQAFGNDYKEIWKKEYDLKEASADAVSEIYDIEKDTVKELSSAKKYLKKAISASKGHPSARKTIIKLRTLVEQNEINANTASTSKEKIYSIAQSLEVKDTEIKVNLFKKAKAALTQSERNTESIKSSISKIKDTIRSIERAERDAERERRRRDRRS
jgi:hypothetical protein